MFVHYLNGLHICTSCCIPHSVTVLCICVSSYSSKNRDVIYHHSDRQITDNIGDGEPVVNVDTSAGWFLLIFIVHMCMFTNIVYQHCLPTLFTNIVYQHCLHFTCTYFRD